MTACCIFVSLLSSSDLRPFFTVRVGLQRTRINYYHPVLGKEHHSHYYIRIIYWVLLKAGPHQLQVNVVLDKNDAS